MRKSIIPACLMLSLTLTVAGTGCGGKSDPSAPPGARVTVESSRRVTRTVGPDGGVLTTTSMAGVAFSLEIPALALPADVEISMAPITSIADLPWSGGLTSAVQLEPSGLVLVVPALLTIGTTANLTGGQRLVGFNFHDGADPFAPTAAIDGADGIRVPVPHFSGAGAAVAGPGDPGYDLCADPDIALRIMCIVPADPERREKFLAAAREYLNDIAVPGVRGDTGLELRDAVIDLYLRWYGFVDHFAVEYQAADWQDVLATDIDAALDLIAARLRGEIAGLKEDLCTSRPAVDVLISIFELNWLALATGVDTAEDGLTEEQTLAGLCAEVVIESFVLPDPMPVDQDISVDVDLRLDLNGTPAEVPFQVNLFGNLDFGSQYERCCGRTNAAGEFTTVVQRSRSGAIVLDLTAFVMLPLFSPEGGLTLTTVPVIGRASRYRGSTGTLTDFPAVVTPGAPASFGVAVVREVSDGVFDPYPNVLVTCSVEGGRADPVVAIADGDGVARSMITADAGVDSVIVRFSVSDNGVELGRGRAAALVVSDGGTITLIERISGSYANTADVGNCPPESDPHWETTSGFLSLSAGVGQTCTSPDPDSDDWTATATSFVSQTSDTGISADGRSAVMTFTATGSSQASARNATARSYYRADFEVYFEIQGGPMTFQLDAMVDASVRGGISIALQTDAWDTLYDWEHYVGDEGPSSILVAGNLPPGRYRGQVQVQGNAAANVWSSSSCSGQATLTLNQATAAP